MFKMRSRGFTLIEVIVVVVIVAILAAIALPNFSAQIRKSRRSDAISQMSNVALNEERWRTNCPIYAAFADATCTPAFMSAPTSGYYTFALSGVSATAYTLTATPIGGQAIDSQAGTSCNPLTLTHNAGVDTKSPSPCFGQ